MTFALKQEAASSQQPAPSQAAKSAAKPTKNQCSSNDTDDF